MMVDASVACMRRDGRRWTIARGSLGDLCSEGRDVRKTGGARARCGVLVSRLMRTEDIAMADAGVAHMRRGGRS